MIEYISKEEAIEAFSDMSDGTPITHGDMISDTVAVNVIKSITSADVRENIHGHWERDTEIDGYRCSNCGSTGMDYWNGCPYCLADMRGNANE